MNKPIIEVEDISKVYRLGQFGATSLREEANRTWRKLRGLEPEQQQGEFWALNGVSFSVNQGEVIGIIGKNGAGKSTLLKILSRITEPTKGRICLRGRVAALLEVGTGMHPELTGKENIYLNGTILGMKKREIDSKFDEIIEFAGITKHINTPVKRYSSGMNVRLGFAVAAHLEPEILIVDEVLAVGDAEFQKKCIGKMQDVAGLGRTVLFVSHNMAAVQNLCPKSLLLEKGQVKAYDDSPEIIKLYNQANRKALVWDRRGNGKIKLLDISVSGEGGEKVEPYSDLHIDMVTKNETGDPLKLDVGVSILDKNGVRLVQVNTQNKGEQSQVAGGAEKRFKFKIPGLPLRSGEYSLKVCLQDSGEIYDLIESCSYFRIEEDDLHGTGRRSLSDDTVLDVKYEVDFEKSAS
ncbi:MAG: ABC transporter ATP-binding protein [Verrucomicrobiota bacterium JB023]|nr:ABC transporter ATP-binding protein [Verrucomicrobiota bacterium JB023]